MMKRTHFSRSVWTFNRILKRWLRLSNQCPSATTSKRLEFLTTSQDPWSRSVTTPHQLEIEQHDMYSACNSCTHAYGLTRETFRQLLPVGPCSCTFVDNGTTHGIGSADTPLVWWISHIYHHLPIKRSSFVGKSTIHGVSGCPWALG